MKTNQHRGHARGPTTSRHQHVRVPEHLTIESLGIEGIHLGMARGVLEGTTAMDDFASIRGL